MSPATASSRKVWGTASWASVVALTAPPGNWVSVSKVAIVKSVCSWLIMSVTWAA
jgi:hypothetical protein